MCTCHNECLLQVLWYCIHCDELCLHRLMIISCAVYVQQVCCDMPTVSQASALIPHTTTCAHIAGWAKHVMRSLCTVQIELWTCTPRCSNQRCCLVGKLALCGEDCPFSVLLWTMQSGESLLSAVHVYCVGVVIPWVAMQLPLLVLQLRCLLWLTSKGLMPKYDGTDIALQSTKLMQGIGRLPNSKSTL